MEFSKGFGPLAAAAATETPLTPAAGWKVPPGGPYHCYRLRVGYANIVNAKENAGYVRVEVDGVNEDFYYIIGHGAGGATNTSGMAAQEIDCSIPLPTGANVIVSIYNAEAIKDAVVSLQFAKGGGRSVGTYKCGGAGSDVTAGTELTIGTMTILKSGKIRQIRFTGSGVVDALAETAILTLEIPGLKGFTFEYAVGHGTAGATLSASSHADVINLDKGIPIVANTIITAKVKNLVTTGSNLLSCAVSIQVV